MDYPIFHGERGGTDADTFSRDDFLRKNEKLVGVSCDVRGCASMAKQQVDSRLVTVKVITADGIEGQRFQGCVLLSGQRVKGLAMANRSYRKRDTTRDRTSSLELAAQGTFRLIRQQMF